MFKGIEANILADGELDLQPDERAVFEFVVASPHSQLRRDHDQTSRMLARGPAARRRHPRPPAGPRLNSRPGWWPTGRGSSRRPRSAGSRSRSTATGTGRTSTSTWRAQALDAGCLFALDSDAHSIGELRFTDYSIAHARLAGIPAERVINCWSDEELEEWMNANPNR